MSQSNKSNLVKILQYSKSYRFRLFLALAASLGVAGAEASFAKLVQPFIDFIIVEKRADLISFVPLIVIGIASLKGGSRFAQEYLIKTTGQRIIQDIRNDLYGHTMRMAMPFFNSTSTGELTSRILNDVSTLKTSGSDEIVRIVRDTFTLIFLVIVAFWGDWVMGVVAFIVLPLCMWPVAKIGRKIKGHSKLGQGAMGDLTSAIEQSLSGIRIVKNFGAEGRESDNFEETNEKFYRHAKKVIKYQAAASPIVEIMTSVGIGAVLWLGMHRVMLGVMSQGELFSVLAAVVLAYAPVKRLTSIHGSVQGALGAAERIFEVMDRDQEPIDVHRPHVFEEGCTGAIELQGVTFSYEDDIVLENVSISIPSGRSVALVGPSGGGKSTIGALISRFYNVSTGSILVDGHNVQDLDIKELRSKIAVVDQDSFLFNDTVASNIRYGRPDASDAEVEEAAKLAFADDFISDLPLGYETVIGDHGSRLSGGQRQRICIARAIIRNAPILILDEATSALDTNSEYIVQKALSNLMKGRTTIVIAHRLSTIQDADSIVVIEKGRVVQRGSHAELVDAEGLYRQLYDKQS